MPSWKKVIVSGSDALLNSLNVTTSITSSTALFKEDVTISGSVFVSDGSEIYVNDLPLYQQSLQDAFTGVVSGGVIAINNTNPQAFDISAGSGYVIDNYTNPLNPQYTYVQWGNLTITASAFPSEGQIATTPRTNIAIDSSGNVFEKSDKFTTQDYREKIVLGRIVHVNSNVITRTLSLPLTTYNRGFHWFDLANSIGPINITGNIYSAGGTNRTIQKSAGQTYRVGSNYAINPQSPDITTDSSANPVSFRYRYRSGSEFIEQPATTIATGSFYDNGSGTLQPVNNNQWTIQRIFLFGATGTTIIQFGQNVYNSKAAAQIATTNEPFIEDPNLTEDSILRSYLIIRGGATDLSNTSDAEFLQATAGGAAGGAGGTVTSLESLSDVEYVTTLIDGQTIIRSGSIWVNGYPASASFASTSSLSLNSNLLNGTGSLSFTTTSSFNSYTSSADGRLDSLETESGSIRTDFNNFTSSYNTGSFTGSFSGDGSGLTGVIAELSSVTSFSEPFTNQTTVTVVHSLDSQFPFVQVYNTDNELFIPQTIKVIDSDTIRVDFSELSSGYIVVAKGGHIVSGTIENANLLNGQSASFYLDYNNFNNVPEYVTTSSFNLFTSSYTTGSFTGSFVGDGSGLTNLPIIDIDTSTLVTTSSFNSYTSSADGRLDSLETESGSVRTDLNTSISNFNSYTSSNDSTNSTQNSRIGSLESFTSSLNSAISLDGSNVTILGNLEVAGTQTIIDSTTVQIGDNIIELNGTGAVNGGLLIRDVTGPNTVSGSLLWDTTNDIWIAGQLGSESKILLAIGDGVVSGSSQISFNGITDKPTLVSGSSQIDLTGTTNYISGIKSRLNAESVISSSVQVNADTITNFDTNVKDKLNTDNVHSGSFLGTATTTNLTEGTNLYYTDTRVKTKLNADGVISGSSQVDHDQTTNFVANKHIDHSTVSITAGSGLSGGGNITATRTLTLDTGSTHFTNGVKTKLNADGVHSGSFLGTATTTNLTEGTNLYYTDSRVKTKLNADGVHSGSFLGTATTTNLTEGTNLYYTDTRVKTKLNTDNVHSGSFLGTATTTNLTEGTNLYYTDTRVKTKLNADSVISGSSQVDINSTNGTLNVNKGGTGQTTYTNGQLLIGNTTGNTLTKATLTEGTGITITNGTGTITITNASPNATHTGDVTGATALTIANDAVGNTKLANMTVNTIKGRITTGTGDPEDLTASQVRTIINVADGATANTGTVTSIATNNGITGGTITTTGTLGLTGQALALHNLATNGIIARTGAGTVAGRTITGTANQVTVTNGDGVSGNPTLSLPQNIHTSATPTFGGSTFNGDVTINGRLLSGQQNLDVDSGAVRVIATAPTGSYDAAFFDYVIKKGTNRRAGTVYTVHNGTTVEFTETSTNDIGTTTDVTLSSDISGGNIRLLATTLSNDWIIKTLVRGL